MEKIIIIGGGGHTKVLISVIRKSLPYEVVGYVDIIDQGTLFGIKYLGNDYKLTEIFSNGITKAALGVGQVELTLKRYELAKMVQEFGFTFPAIISKDAILNEPVLIEAGTQIMDGVIINSGSSIGSFNIINTKSVIEHDCKIGNFCHIATAAVLCGGVEVGDFSIIGANSVVNQYKKITSNCLIGSGSVVTKDINEEGVYVGNPARKIK